MKRVTPSIRPCKHALLINASSLPRCLYSITIGRTLRYHRGGPSAPTDAANFAGRQSDQVVKICCPCAVDMDLARVVGRQDNRTLRELRSVADKITVAMEAVGDKILLNSQGWEVRGSSASGRGADGRGALGAALSVATAFRARWQRRGDGDDYDDYDLHHAVAPGVTRDETRNTFD